MLNQCWIWETVINIQGVTSFFMLEKNSLMMLLPSMLSKQANKQKLLLMPTRKNKLKFVFKLHLLSLENSMLPML